jgi:hypothetical protein
VPFWSPTFSVTEDRFAELEADAPVLAAAEEEADEEDDDEQPAAASQAREIVRAA